MKQTGKKAINKRTIKIKKQRKKQNKTKGRKKQKK
jgi:hypothetical protein